LAAYLKEVCTMQTCDQYIARAKAAFGDSRMSDRALGELLGYSQQHVAQAKHGRMSDPLAIAIADAIKADRGEVIVVARAARERDAETREALLAYVGKIARLAATKASAAAVAAVVLCGALLPHDALAKTGGVGRFRRRLA
jgi:hypothetical protein